MTVRRLLWLVPIALVLGAIAYTTWLTWQVQNELRAAESSATDLQAAWRVQDVMARERAADDLAGEAAAAHAHTDGVWWRALGHLPVVGDDASGVAAMSESLDVIARDAVTPLGATADNLESLVGDGRIDLDTVARLRAPVRQAHRALVTADEDLTGLDSDGYLDTLRTRFDEYAALVEDLRSGLASAETAVSVLPTMAGADGPRDYLLIFQNNAEIRATGGSPGSWALVRAEGGQIEMTRQGAAGDFPVTAEPVLPLTSEELAVYGEELGTNFADPGWSMDFPRAADLWQAHWNQQFPGTAIAGVIAVDPVAISYLLDGTGPVTVDDVTLTGENAIDELLNEPYIEKGRVEQDAFFRAATRAIFRAATGSLASPIAFVEGLNRAASESRLLVAPFEDRVRRELAGSRVEGALSGDDGATPHVDIGFDDITGSKMSYYLRYNAEVDAMSCPDGRQELSGVVTMSQVISPSQATTLPASVTGDGSYGTDAGSQYVMVRIYGPYGGSIDQVLLDGRPLEAVPARQLNGRPVVNVDVLLSSRKDVLLTWHGITGQGQIAGGVLGTTPHLLPGPAQQDFASACSRGDG